MSLRTRVANGCLFTAIVAVGVEVGVAVRNFRQLQSSACLEAKAIGAKLAL